MSGLISLNLHLIDQAESYLRDLTDELYSRPCEAVFSSSIGQHLRHCVEHYEEFLLAHETAREVNYDRRPRDEQIERSSSAASMRLVGIAARLENVDLDRQWIEVSDTGAEAPTSSTIDRELQYLVSHTVHHFALIAVISQQFEIGVPAEFGVAPSTLQYRSLA